jgi:hypothetical protein
MVVCQKAPIEVRREIAVTSKSVKVQRAAAFAGVFVEATNQVHHNERLPFYLHPPAKKQRTAFLPTPLPSAVTTPLWRPCPPICAPPFQGLPSHQQLLLSFNLPSTVTRNSTPFAHNNFTCALPSSVVDPVNPNFRRFPSFMAATPNPIELFGFTPFGIYCRVCKDHVGASQQMIKTHLEVKNHGVFSRDAINTIKTMADKEVERLSRQANLDLYLIGRSEGLACGCGALFAEKKALARHCKGVKSCSFDPKEARPEWLYKTSCGRTVSEATLNRLSSLPPTAVDSFDFATTATTLGKYIREKEVVGPFIAIFHPFFVSPAVSSSAEKFDSLMKSMVGWWSMPVAEEELGLQQVLNAAEDWIYHAARRHVEMVPGNLRAALQVFDGQEVGEVAQNYVYNFRHDESRVLDEVKELLSFVWRHPGNLLLSFKHSVNASNTLLVPSILQVLLQEKVQGFNSHPLVVEYCLARCFRKKADELYMPSCGDSSSAVAAVLSILRAGACSYIVLKGMSDKQAKEFVQNARSSRVLNIISPMIRRFRMMERRKPKLRMLTVSPEGGIAVDGFELTREEWSKTCPRVFTVCRELLDLLFESDDWTLFLDQSTPISVSRSAHGEFDFSLSISGKEVKSSELVLKQSNDRALALVLDRLRSYVEICFHGLGGGSMRHSELLRLTLLDAIWHRGTIYYAGESMKAFSIWSIPNGKTTEHKLPVIMARVYLLFHRAASKLNDYSLIPLHGKRTHTMPDAFAELFNFSKRPTLLQIRHFWTSMCNVIFPNPKGATVIVSATAEVAEMSAHTAATHDARYGSELIGGKELNYRKYHNALGAVDVTSTSNDEIRPRDLFTALKYMYGPDADYTSDLQRQMVVASSSATSDKHSHVGMPCGSGKSLAWELPRLAAALTGKKIGMQIVVLPYNFLVCHLENSARKNLQNQFDVSVLSMTSAECSQQALPVEFAIDEHLPDLVFFGLDAFVSFQGNHRQISSTYHDIVGDCS